MISENDASSPVPRLEWKWVLVLLGVALSSNPVAARCASERETQLLGLTVEYAVMPLGLDTSNPRFAWQAPMPARVRASTIALNPEDKNGASNV
jgi:hypothetical protein